MASTTRAPSGSVFPQPSPPPEESIDAPSGPAAPKASVPLARLLEVAWLNPAQTVLVGALALERAGRDASAASLRLTAAGSLVDEPEGSSLSAGNGAGRPAAGASPARELLGLLHRSAHRRALHPTAVDDELLHGLGAAAQGDLADPAGCARELRLLLAHRGLDTERLTAQLGVLAGQAMRGFPELRPVRGSTATQPIPESRPARIPERRVTERVRHRRHTGRLVGTLAALVAVLALAAGYFTITGQAGPWVHRLLGNGGSTAAGTSTTHHHAAAQRHHRARAAHHHHGQVHRFGPASAGPVHHVAVHPVGACAPGTACTVKVTVGMAAAPVARPVSWRIGIVDRCTGQAHWKAPLAMTAQPGWTTVFATSPVTLHGQHRHALVARTTAPAHAASRSLPLPGGHC